MTSSRQEKGPHHPKKMPKTKAYKSSIFPELPPSSSGELLSSALSFLQIKCLLFFLNSILLLHYWCWVYDQGLLLIPAEHRYTPQTSKPNPKSERYTQHRGEKWKCEGNPRRPGENNNLPRQRQVHATHRKAQGSWRDKLSRVELG